MAVGNADVTRPVRHPTLDESQGGRTVQRTSTSLVRTLALLCACSLSIGSHFGMHMLGPLKSRLSREIGTSNAQFSLLIAAFSLNSTWTPLVGGLLASHLGTATSSIIATSTILIGQVILILGEYSTNIVAMTLGMFVFGLGIAPLSVVQETIIVRNFGHRLGLSLALGLVAGKAASFAGASTSYPLSQTFGQHAPFVVSAALAGFSFLVNLAYISASKWFAQAGVSMAEGNSGIDYDMPLDNLSHETEAHYAPLLTEDAARRLVAEKRRVHLRDVARFGDEFWLYIALNVACGAIWWPFTHLASNMIQVRYGTAEADAGFMASLLLAGSIFLYPLCGYAVDKYKTALILHYLLIASSVLTLLCYSWLVLPPSLTKTPLPAVLLFAANGFSSLLLVLIVPHLVPLKYISTALGIHKCIEQAGSVVSQTVAGLVLDLITEKSPRLTPHRRDAGRNTVLKTESSALQGVLTAFLVLNLVHLAVTIAFWQLHVRRSIGGASRFNVCPAAQTIATNDAGETEGLLSRTGTKDEGDDNTSHTTVPHNIERFAEKQLLPTNATEAHRGRYFSFSSFTLVACTWILFLAVAALKLRTQDQVHV
ncbi:MFS general substrate transporter [Auriculariales sp. MPI-PUGE-AT-0066]|nr:MFS general substrate transporter [Auriculariales sp. MPI-PUGE-AT-0066]